jgi:hypothetical protein
LEKKGPLTERSVGDADGRKGGTLMRRRRGLRNEEERVCVYRIRRERGGGGV